ncbi:aminopeptidase [Halosimplex litoreum]|uniref:Aminopeptidase n=1 Tax=Halosimplex litoreum TaxID=1198301 RepID=A0A7T3G0Q0_9EURY|nr:aminopeptidase [Halosimplex litoreum]QPV64234.1 aminopeptidase [Halosimplex litoreum]
MDPRVEDQADVVVDHSIDLQAGDEVLISAPAVAEDLVVALEERIAERGAHSVSLGGSARAQRAFKRAMDPEDYDEPPASLVAMVEEIDAAVGVRAATNTHETGDVPPEKNAAYAQIMKPIQDAYTDKRWVATQYPATGNAQAAEMSTEAYEDFVYDAVTKDWDEQRAFQANMIEILEGADEVRIVSGDTTDVTMSVSGMNPVNDYAEKNLPGGEVFTAPVPDSVEGEVLFDMPLMAQGREVEDVRLVFEDGEVVDSSAGKNEDVLAAVLDTDPGARRLGELGIGMNRDIDRFTYNMLFDEKMGDTVHMALGRTIDENVPDDGDVEGNDSAMHMDMIVDMSEDSYIEVDGERVQEDGTFRFEDGFEA